MCLSQEALIALSLFMMDSEECCLLRWRWWESIPYIESSVPNNADFKIVLELVEIQAAVHNTACLSASLGMAIRARLRMVSISLALNLVIA
jgi:hypothetical protein